MNMDMHARLCGGAVSTLAAAGTGSLQLIASAIAGLHNSQEFTISGRIHQLSF